MGMNNCSFELYIINNDEYTDYSLGEKVEGEVWENGYDCFTEDVCACGIPEEIANELYKTTNGQFKYVVRVDVEYTTSTGWDGTEYDMDYTYSVVSKEPTNYFDEMEEEKDEK